MSSTSPRKILIISGQHFATSPRKVDLHFMTEAFLKDGHQVSFLTLRISWLSRFLDDGRWKFAKSRQTNKWVSLSPGLDEFIWVNLIHPINLKNKFLNRLTSPFFKLYGKLIPKDIKKRLGDYTHVIIESGLPPLLFEDLKRQATQAIFIYHGADRLSTIGVHPLIESVLARTADRYDIVRVMATALKDDFPAQAPVICLPHGISKEDFAYVSKSPYRKIKNAISIGDMLFDSATARDLAIMFPDWTFHFFGKLATVPDAPDNIIEYGEKPFNEILPYIKYADIGLALYLHGRGADYLSQSSMKMIQYTFASLPIVAPEFTASGRPHVCAYQPNDPASLKTAFEKAVSYDRADISKDGIYTWDEVSTQILNMDKVAQTNQIELKRQAV